ncbi:MAG: hypothetical protein WDM77_10050 [Steroidobacteraceae bacterium]
MMRDSQISTGEPDRSFAARAIALGAYVAKQVLLFWPPYRIEPDGEGHSSAEPGEDGAAGRGS